MNLKYVFPSRSLTRLRMGSLTSILSKGKLCDYPPRVTSTLDTRLFWKNCPIVPFLCLETSVITTLITHKAMVNTLAWHPRPLTNKLSWTLFFHSWPKFLPALPALWIRHDFPTSSKSWPLTDAGLPSKVPLHPTEYILFGLQGLKSFLLRKSSLISFSS